MTKEFSYDDHLTSLPWSDYELLDSGENMKLERFGTVVVARPETQALWKKGRPELWDPPSGGAHAVFAFGDAKGAWDVKKPIPDPWELSWEDIRFSARLTGFKHVGVFPEQAPNWQWLADRCRDVVRPTSDVGRTTSYIPKILNLFGYTGIASIVAAKTGIAVTHVDASKQSLDWARENARLSHLGEGAIRWILDDALAFAKRELRRLPAQAGDARYNGIVLDPPAFGRGAKKEVWKIEEDLPKLLDALKGLLADAPGSFFLLNGYAAGYAPRSFAQAVEGVFATRVQAGELHIKEASSERVIPSGIYMRFVR